MRVSINNDFKFIIPRDKNSLLRGHLLILVPKGIMLFPGFKKLKPMGQSEKALDEEVI